MVSVCLSSDALLQHLPSNLGFSYLGRRISIYGSSSKAQPLLLTLDEDHGKSKRIPEKHLFLLYWLCQGLCVEHSKLWKILKEMGIPDHPTCLLRNLYAGQEATDWFQIRKGECQGCILSPCLFNFYAEYIMRNAGLEEAQLESRLPGEISITSDMQMTRPLWQKVKKN